MANISSTSTAPTAPRRPARRKMPRWIPLLARGLSAATPHLAAALFAHLFVRPQRRKILPQERALLLSAAARPLPMASGRQVPIYEWLPLNRDRRIRDEAPLPTVLLVHGFGGNSAQMTGFVPPLLAAGYRVVAFDAPAHGAAPGATCALPEVLEDVVGVASRLGPLAGVVAHSAGATAVMAGLVQGIRAERVVLLSPMSDLQSFMRRVASQSGFSPRVVELAQKRIEVRYDHPLAELAGVRLARQLHQPALILQDSADKMVPLAEVEDLAKSWPEAELSLSAGLGHNRILKDKKVIERVTEYLAS